MNVSFKIKIFDSKGTRVLQVAKSTLTIGGAPHCDVVIEHPSVGSEHARAWWEGGRIWVQDLGTPNGTALNDIRLPALKPMLVRDLDVLRLGQSEATLGLEAIVVRAPVVKSKAVPAAAPDAEASGAPKRDLEIDQRREELAGLARQLAELRLQMQMTKLDRDSNAETAQHLQNLRDEIKVVEEQKTKWNETFRQMEAEKQQMRRGVEVELSEFKKKTLAEALQQHEFEVQKLEAWKHAAVTDLSQTLRKISLEKIRTWATRPLSQSMINDWEAVLNHAFRRVLLNENTPAPAPVDLPPLAVAPVAASATAPSAGPQVQAPQPAPQPLLTIDLSDEPSQVKKSTKAAVHAAAETVVHDVRKSTKKRPTSRMKSRTRRQLAVTSVVLVVVAALLLGAAYFRQYGARSLSSVATPSPTPVAAAVVPAEVAPSLPHHSGHFEPKQTHKFRGTYTDNVLYLQSYVEAEQNSDFHRKWSSELGRVAAQEWKMDPFVTGSVLNKEQILIQDLNRIRGNIHTDTEQEGISQMRSREALFLKDLEATFKNRSAVERFLKFKRSFYMRNQAYLSTSNS